MAGYYGIIQSVVKRGYNAFQVTFRVHPVRDAKEINSIVPDKSHNETLVYRVDVAVDDNRLILFPDRELARCLRMYRNSSERASDSELTKWHDVGRIADSLCRHVSSLLFEKNNRVNVSFIAHKSFNAN